MKQFILQIIDFNPDIYQISYIDKYNNLVEIEKYNNYIDALEALKRYTIINDNDHISEKIYNNIILFKDNYINIYDFILLLFKIFNRHNEQKFYNLILLLRSIDIENKMKHKNFKFSEDIMTEWNFNNTFLFLFITIHQSYIECGKFNKDENIKYFIDTVRYLFENEEVAITNNIVHPYTMKSTIDCILNTDNQIFHVTNIKNTIAKFLFK